MNEVNQPLNGATAGELLIPRGIDQFELSALNSADELFQAQLTDPKPEVQVENGRVTINYPQFVISYMLKRPKTSHIALNSRIPWRFEIGQGAKGLTGDLSKFEFKGLIVAGGAADVELTLPKPSGHVPIHFKGGVNHLTLKRPSHTETRLSIKGGATHVKLDAQSAGAIGGGMSWQSSGFDDASDRYEIEIGGGATHITVE